MKKLLVMLLCLVFLTGCMVVAVPEKNPPEKPDLSDRSAGLTVHFIDVGQADCALLICDGKTMLIDGGNVDDAELVVSYLRQQGVEYLDYVVGTHAHEDHIGGLGGVMAAFEAGTVWSPVDEHDTTCFAYFKRYSEEQGLTLECPEPGSEWELGSAIITVLGPVAEYEDTNNTSIVLAVDYGDTSFLFTGDAEAEAEKDILKAGYDVSATVLKVGHHGSNTSSCYQWLKAVGAEYGVISCETGNDYGHPHDEPLSRLRDADVELYRTDLQGHIVCTSDGRSVSFATEKHAAITNPTAVDGSGQNSGEVTFIGNKNSRKFHVSTCNGLPSEKNRVQFESYDSAVAQGYEPCGTCIGG